MNKEQEETLYKMLNNYRQEVCKGVDCDVCDTKETIVKNFINKLLKEEEEENFSANKLLFDRFTEWQNEWQAEKPKERALTHHDLKRLIEWKIEKLLREQEEKFMDQFFEGLGFAYKRGFKDGFTFSAETMEEEYDDTVVSDVVNKTTNAMVEKFMKEYKGLDK